MVSVRASDRSYLRCPFAPAPPPKPTLQRLPSTPNNTAPECQRVPADAPVSYIASPSLLRRAWARFTGRAFAAFPPVPGTNTPWGMAKVYLTHGLDGVVEMLWRKAEPQQEFCYGWVAGQLVVVMRSPEMVHAAFSHNSPCTSRLNPNYEGPFGGIYRIFGNNVFTQHDDDMRRSRQVVLHRFFMRRNIRQHFDKIVDTANAHIDALLHAPERATGDVGKCMVAFTMDTWCRAQMGMPALGVPAAMRLSRAISDGEALATGARQLVWRGVLQRLHLRDLGTTDGNEKALRAGLFEVMRKELIEPHQKALQTSDNLLRVLAESEAEAGRDGAFDAEGVMSELGVLLLTGHETAASLLTWTLCELARNPQALKKLRAEVSQVFAGAAPTLETLDNTPYLDNVLNEALRLHPPAPYLGRTVTKQFTVSTRHGPVTFPEATMLATSLLAQHRIPEVWGNDAEAFRPERFNKISREDMNVQFMPFSVGDRRCAGYPFALMESKIFLVRLLQRTNFTLPNVKNVEHVYVGVLKTAKPQRMEVSERPAATPPQVQDDEVSGNS